jgi:FkbM family methyltransferase
MLARFWGWDGMRYPVLQQSLKLIRKLDPSAISTVIDIGVQRSTPFLIDAFPDCFHHLFEPVSVYYDDIKRIYGERNVKYLLHKIALSNETRLMYLHNTSSDGSGRVTHSYIKPERDEKMLFLKDIEQITSSRLDDVFESVVLDEMSYLIKLDVDGVEEKIIEGGLNVIKNASFVVIETSIGRNDLCSRAALFEKCGFRIFDICDHAYYYNQLALVDLVLINTKLRSQNIKFRPWEYTKTKVIWSKWQHGFADLVGKSVDDPFEV